MPNSTSPFASASRRLLALVCLGALVETVLPSNARAQIFVVGRISETIGEYSLGGSLVAQTGGFTSPLWITASTSELFYTDVAGTTIGRIPYPSLGGTANPTLVTGLSGARGVALFGSNLFVGNSTSGIVGKYTTAGGTVNAGFLTGFQTFGQLLVTVSDTNLFVLDVKAGTVGSYDAATGTAINASLLTLDPFSTSSLAVSGTDLFIGNSNGTVGKYTTGGGVVNPTFISLGSSTQVSSLAVSGSDLLVGQTAISKYDVGTGALLNGSFISGFAGLAGIAVAPVAAVPEPALGPLLGGVMAFVLTWRRRRGQRS